MSLTSSPTQGRGSAGVLQQLETILAWAMSQSAARAGVIGLQFSDSVICCVSRGSIAPPIGTRLGKHALQCIMQRQTIKVDNILSNRPGQSLRAVSLLSVPVSYEGLSIGVLELFSDAPGFVQNLQHRFEGYLRVLCNFNYLVPASAVTTPSPVNGRDALDVGGRKAADGPTADCGVAAAKCTASAETQVPGRLSELRDILHENAAGRTWDQVLEELTGYFGPPAER